MKGIKEYRPVIIGVDHGYGNIKTAHRVFRCGIEKDENFFLLTLAAIAEELPFKGGFTEANLVLAVGLPLARVSSQKDAFRAYLMQEREVEFDYKGKHHHIYIDRVLIFPQGFSETVLVGKLPGDNMILDIGNGTMNIARVVDGRPIEKSLLTMDYGVSFCVRNIQSELSRKLGRSVDEDKIEERIRNGCSGRSDEISIQTVEQAKKYAEEIIMQLAVNGYDDVDTKLYVFGGGGCLLKNYSSLPERGNVVFNDDICANAKGYESLAERKLKAGGGKG